MTNIQYRCFVAAGGYAADQPWWTPKIVADIEQYDSNWRDGPRLWDDDRFNHSTQPVVGVSWYEAGAYCGWLTGELRRVGQIGQNEEIRLPKEAEWMRAAFPPPSNSPQNGVRADLSSGEKGSFPSNPLRAGGITDGSSGGGELYPWGSADFDPARANTKESGLEQTTPVQMYPDGASAAGVWDLAGNVWEWSADWNEDKYRWLTGGAYYHESDGVRTPSRGWYNPGGRSDYVGSWVVVVPSSHG